MSTITIPKGCMYSRAQSAVEVLKEPSSDILENLKALIEVYFFNVNKPEWFRIFKKRFGLDGCSQTLMADIGREHQITRERVRQIIFIMVHQIKKLMDGHQLDKPRIFCDKNALFTAFSKDLSLYKIVTLSKIKFILKIYSKVESEDYLDLLMHLYGYEYSTYEGIKFYYKEYYCFSIFKAIYKFKKFMSRQALFISEKEIKRALKITQEDLEFYLNFIPEIEKSGASYRVPFKDLYSEAICAHRILHDIGHPIHIDELLNELRKNGRSGSRTCLKGEVIPIGHSGYWVLKSWGIETGSISNLIERTLLEAKEPLTAEILTQRIDKIRSVSINDIKSQICTYKDRFVRYCNNSYGLKKWPLKIPIKSRRKYSHSYKFQRDLIIEKVEGILKDGKKRTLDDILRHLESQGHLRASIYSAISRSRSFIKEKIEGSNGLYISLKRH